jgi:hypothetical protein
MKLSGYAIKLSHYPSLRFVAPYRGWDSGAPTKSLIWYDSYNATKHDRAGNFSRATIYAAYQAVCAVWIMILAQYGVNAAREFDDLNNYFEVVEIPFWRYSESYSIAYEGCDGEAGPRNYPF